MRRVGILATWFCLSSSVAWGALYNNDVPECAALGYDMSLSECQSQMQSLFSGDEAKKYNPLHCPYDYNKVKCWKNNCGGYTIAEPNANFESEECLLGIDGGKVQKMYRYKSCLGKDGVNYRYNNGDCIDRCDLNAYPYDTPPGSLYGKVESCYDDAMHYGYSACNEGFGKLVNGEYVPNNGRCDMLICDINAYPYFERPDDSRGEIEVCVGGTNKYYRFNKESCEKNGYQYKGGVCRKSFDITQKSFVDVRFGDALTYKGTEIAAIVHTPDKVDNRYLAVQKIENTGRNGPADSALDELPLYPKMEDALKDFRGKCNTKKFYEAIKENVDHQQMERAYNYYPSVCGKDNEYCGAGQWYIPALGEVDFMLDTSVYYVSKKVTRQWDPETYTTSTQASKNALWGIWVGTGNYGPLSFLTDFYHGAFYIEFGPNKLTCE